MPPRQATRAGVKAVGIVVDDTAVTPRYVLGFMAERELPIVGKIALGSLRNKLLILLPAALAFSQLAPWAITPLLMLGGAYLCYEGAEKVIELVRPHAAPDKAEKAPATVEGAKREEDRRVRGAIRTDLILSAEIMAVTLGSVADSPFWTRVFVLAVVGVGITALVYGTVAIIVKADDVGLALARSRAARGACHRPRHRPRDAALPQAAGPGRHRGHALGRRRDRPARVGAVWLGGDRPWHRAVRGADWPARWAPSARLPPGWCRRREPG